MTRRTGQLAMPPAAATTRRTAAHHRCQPDPPRPAHHHPATPPTATETPRRRPARRQPDSEEAGSSLIAAARGRTGRFPTRRATRNGAATRTRGAAAPPTSTPSATPSQRGVPVCAAWGCRGRRGVFGPPPDEQARLSAAHLRVPSASASGSERSPATAPPSPGQAGPGIFECLAAAGGRRGRGAGCRADRNARLEAAAAAPLPQSPAEPFPTPCQRRAEERELRTGGSRRRRRHPAAPGRAGCPGEQGGRSAAVAERACHRQRSAQSSARRGHRRQPRRCTLCGGGGTCPTTSHCPLYLRRQTASPARWSP